MKKQNSKIDKTKIITRVIIAIFLIANMLSLTSCGGLVNYSWETNSHKDFADYINKYNSLHDLYLETNISFDLDNNEKVTKSIYYIFAMLPVSRKGYCIKNGHTCDLHVDGLSRILVYYLKGDGENANGNEYKIKCSFSKVPFNFTNEDEFEIRESSCEYYSSLRNLSNDLVYENSIQKRVSSEEIKNNSIYNNVYHYTLYVNGVRSCCIHISSVEKASEEKLAEIHQMLLDNMVVINGEGLYIWRNQK